MSIKIITTYVSQIKTKSRLEPRYFLFQKILNNTKKSFGFVKLGDISDNIIRGQSPKPDTYKDKFKGEYIFIRTADIKKYQINFQSTIYLDKDTFDIQKSNRIKVNDILISVVGNYLGSCAVIPSNILIGAFNDNSARIRIKNKQISPYFVTYFLNSNFGQQLIHSLLTRTGQKILSSGNVKKIEIPEIQNNKIDELGRKVEESEMKAITILEEVQDKFHQMLDVNFIDIPNQKYFSVNLSDFVKEDLLTPSFSYPLYVNTLKAIQNKYKTIQLGEIVNIKKGDEVGSDNYINYIDKKDSDVPFIRTSDFVNYEVDQFPDFYIPEEIYQELNQDINAGDVLFTKDGKIGMSAMITKNDKVIIASGMVRMRLKAEAKKYNFTPEYLFIVLSMKETGLYPAIRRTVIASTIPHLREDKLKEFEIPILDKNSIDEITILVKEAFELKDEKKKLIKEVIEEIDSYFNI